jgi:hypothetical protein
MILNRAQAVPAGLSEGASKVSCLASVATLVLGLVVPGIGAYAEDPRFARVAARGKGGGIEPVIQERKAVRRPSEHPHKTQVFLEIRDQGDSFAGHRERVAPRCADDGA